MRYVEKNLSVYLNHRAELLDYATAIVGDRSHGEDVVQEAFLRLRSAAADRTLEEPLGYLRRIIRNLAIDWVRRLAREGKLLAPTGIDEAIVEERPSPETALAHRDELRIVLAAMAELPERTRAALEMHRFDGLKLKEIASRLGVSVALAHALVYEGLEHCRERLSRGT